jgi:hypothetical protein
MSEVETRGDMTRVEFPVDRQGLIYFPGDGLPLVMFDHGDDLASYFSHFTPTMRAVMVARLRSWAVQIVDFEADIDALPDEPLAEWELELLRKQAER